MPVDNPVYDLLDECPALAVSAPTVQDVRKSVTGRRPMFGCHTNASVVTCFN